MNMIFELYLDPAGEFGQYPSGHDPSFRRRPRTLAVGCPRMPSSRSRSSAMPSSFGRLLFPQVAQARRAVGAIAPHSGSAEFAQLRSVCRTIPRRLDPSPSRYRAKRTKFRYRSLF